MDLREFYQLAERADAAKTGLEHEAATYEVYLEMFYSEEDRPISKEHLLDETRKVSEVLSANENLLEDLQEARGQLKDVNQYRRLNAEKDVDWLIRRAEDIIEDYDRVFREVMGIASRPEKDPSIPGPITMKSMENIEDRFNVEEDLPPLMELVTR